MKVKLGDLYKISSGGTPLKSNRDYYENGTINWVKTGDLKQQYLYDTEDCITELGLNNSSTKMYTENTVLIAMYGATIGATSILKIPACTNQACAAFPQIDVVIPEYLYYFLISKKKQFIKDGVGGAQPNISATYLKNVDFNFVDFEAQQRIVQILKKVNKVIICRGQQLEMLDELIKSRFIEMFGDPSKNEKNWDVAEIGEYLNVLTDYHSNGSYESLRDNVTLLDIPDYALMVRTTNLENNNFEKDVKYIDEHAYNHLEKSKVFGGEIIINKIGSAGKIYLMPFLNRPVSLAMNQFLLRFDENKVNHIYIYNLLLTPYMESKIKEKVRGAVTKTITKDAIREIQVMIPPIQMQKEFINFVNQIDKLKLVVKESLEKLETMKKALMHQYFS